MAGVVADPAFFLDQVGDPRRRPQTALVAQSLRPSLEAAFDAPQVFPPQAGFASRSSGPLQPPQSAFLQLLRPATDGLSMSTDAASNFRLVYALPQQFGRLTAALFRDRLRVGVAQITRELYAKFLRLIAADERIKGACAGNATILRQALKTFDNRLNAELTRVIDAELDKYYSDRSGQS